MQSFYTIDDLNNLLNLINAATIKVESAETVVVLKERIRQNMLYLENQAKLAQSLQKSPTESRPSVEESPVPPIKTPKKSKLK